MKLDSVTLHAALTTAGFNENAVAAERLSHYLQSIVLWNKAYNLTAIHDPKEMVVKHLYDSLALKPHLLDRFGSRPSPRRIIDVGSGAGLPGIPLAIVMPDDTFTLLDSSLKRTRFMQQMVFELKLKNVTVVQARVQDYRGAAGFDMILSRAFASAEDMVAWSAHLLKDDGVFAAMKGQINSTEWDQLSVGLRTEFVTLNVPQLDEARHLVFLSR